MDQLVSDRAQVELSKKIKDVLRHLSIDDWQSESHCKHQNPAERCHRHVKHATNHVLNLSGAPADCWLLVMACVCFIFNRTALSALSWRTPIEVLTGSAPDISMMCRFKFWDKVSYKHDESRGGKQFPSQSNGCFGRFVGFSESAGLQMMHKINRSRITHADSGTNLRLEPVLDSTCPHDHGELNDSANDEFDKILNQHPPPYRNFVPEDNNDDDAPRDNKILELLDDDEDLDDNDAPDPIDKNAGPL